MNHNRYEFLDGIRGMAAIFVLIRHTTIYWHIYFYRSYLAVDLFFILSGFVIAYAYDEKIRNGIITFPKFVLIRLIRLYPVFLLSLLISSVLLIGKLSLKHQINFADLSEVLSVVAITALFLPSHLEGSNYLFPINVPCWSLFFELLANFMYAAIRPFLSNFILTTIVLLFGLLVSSISYQQGGLFNGHLWGSESFIAGFSRSIFGIFLGLFLYRNQAKFRQYLNKPYLAWFAFFSIAIILSSPSAKQFNWLIDVLTVVIIFPIAVLCASQGKSKKLQGLLLMLGSASYPIYVLHLPVARILFFQFKGAVVAFAPISGFVLLFILITISIWVEKYYDIPLRRWISNYAFVKGKLL
jgi:peptidoglycan/LPS O-acetylase OafA/YrhL